MTIPVTQSPINAPGLSPAVTSNTGASGMASLFDALLAALNVDQGQPISDTDADAPASSGSFPWPVPDAGEAPLPTPIDDDTTSSQGGLPPSLDGSLSVPLPQQGETAQPAPAKPANTAGLNAPPVKNSALRVLAANAYAEAAALGEPEMQDSAPQAVEPAGAHIASGAYATSGVQASSKTTIITSSNEPQPPQPTTDGETAEASLALTNAGPGTTTDVVPGTAEVQAPAPSSEEPQDSAPSDNTANPNANVDLVAKTAEDNTVDQTAAVAQAAVAAIAQPAVATAVAVTEPQPLVGRPSVTVSNTPQVSSKVSTPQGKTPSPNNTNTRATDADRQPAISGIAEKAEAAAQPKPQDSAPKPHAGNEAIPAVSSQATQTAVQPPVHTPNPIDMGAPAASGPITTSNPDPTNAPVHFEVTTIAGLPTDMGSLALRIATKSSAGESEFTVQLDPPDLGRIEVRLNVNSQGSAQANLIADKPQTLDLLQRDAPMLERALKDAGLDLAGGMSFSLKSDGQPGDWRDTLRSGQGRASRIDLVDAAGANTATIPSASLIAADWAAGTMRLDIRV